MIVNIHEAKTTLSKLVERVEAGEEIVIGRNNRPVARLVPYGASSVPRRPGRWNGRVVIADDFDDTPGWLLDAFEGSGVSLLLDTHALLWWLRGEGLTPDATERIADPATLVAVSAVSVWEAGIKAALGKLELPGSLAGAVIAEGFEPLAVTMPHAELAGSLPAHHRDPFDRMLVAQAMAEGLTLVSRDPVFGRYDVAVLPA